MALITLDNTITIALSVRDKRESAKWYAETLGFKELYHADEVGWCEMTTNTEGVTLGLGEQTEPSPGNAIPVFGVGDIAEARQVLEGAGIKFDGDTIEIAGMVRIATFFDPDGNALMLAEDLTK